jgi:hypothetical protein
MRRRFVAVTRRADCRALESFGIIGVFTGEHVWSGNGRADDVGFNYGIVGAADEKQMLDIVAAQQNQLPPAVAEVKGVNNAEARGAPAPAFRRGDSPGPAHQLADDDQNPQASNDDARYKNNGHRI